MSSGTGSAVAVFAGVLVATGALAFLLYQAGEGDGATAADDPSSLAPARRVPARERIAPEEAPPLPLEPPPHLQKPRDLDAGSKARYVIEGHEDVALRDWKDVVAAYRGMRDVFRCVAEKGVPVPSEDLELLRDRSEKLDKAALRPPPGSKEGQAITVMDHPAFAANLVAAVLEREHLPLSEAQARRLGDLARERSVVVDRANEAAEKDDGSYLLERLAARARAYEGFYAELYSMLTPAQAEAFSPAEFRHRLLSDLASPAVAWRRMSRPLFVEDELDVLERLTVTFASQFQLEGRREELRAIIETWVKADSIPAADAYDSRGLLRCSLVSAAVARMQDLLRRIVEGMKLEGDMAENARLTPEAFVLLRR